MRKTLFSALVFCAGLAMVSPAHAQITTIYIAPTGGFEANIAAAFHKKDVPASIVTREEEARYILRPSAVEIHKESGVSKLARCAFAYCVGIEDSGEVTVELIDRENSRIVWAYEVAKQRAVRNRQSMAEAIAKHLRKEFFDFHL